MNKKLLISLGFLSTISITVPILATVSCASTDTPVDNKYLIIIARQDPKILGSDIDALKGSDLPAQLTALQKLFGGPGLTLTNQVNFRIAINEDQKIVTLTAINGFTINGKSVLESNKYIIEPVVEIIDLTITPTIDPKLTDAEVAILKAADDNAKWPVLQKLFTGKDFVSANQDKFTATFDEAKLTVTLTAKTGFTIGGKQSLSNTFTIDNNPVIPTDLKITVKSNVTLSVIQFENLVSGTDAEKQAVLGLLFDPITADNYQKFTFTVKELTVTLIAKPGSIFGTSQTLSNTFTVNTPPVTPTDLKITAKSNVKLTTAQVGSLSTGTDTEKQTVLSLLFDPITAENYKNFNFTIVDSTVTLIAKQGFIFGTSQTLINTFTIDNPKVNLNIRATGNPRLNGNQIIDLLSTTPANQLIALQLLFTGVDLIQDNLTKFTVSINQQTNIVTLTAAEGFSINNQNTLSSASYTVDNIFLGLTVIRTAAKFTPQEIILLKQNNTIEQERLLSRLFDPVKGNYQKFDVFVNEASRTVSITPNQGFVFPANQLILTSTPWIVS
ncbi:MAG: hypothetical protein ACRDBR_00310 [Metamycoplasmataceae bacterium]